MGSFFQAGRVSGIVLLTVAAIGIIFSLVGLFFTWSEKLSISDRIFKGMDLLDRTLNTSSDGLVLIGSSLKTSQQTLQVIRTTANRLSDTAGKTAPMLNDMGDTIGQQMTGVVHNTQSSLSAAQSSARLIDDTLSFIGSIPFIGRRYTPAQSLSDSLGSVSASLDGLPDSFQRIQSGLKTTAKNVSSIQEDMQAIQSNIDAAESSIHDAQQIIERYQGQVNELQTQVNDFRLGLPGWIQAVKWMLTLIFLWMAVEQVTFLILGLEWVRSDSRVRTGDGNNP